jgi:hypothetical protein
MANYHVIKDKINNIWGVKRIGAKRFSGYYATQTEAEQVAKQFAANSGGGEVRIHNLKGKIRDSDTVEPGNDPCPPKDKKF